MTPEPLLQFGMAGLMGVLWVWERTHSRKRETQLTAAHEQLSRQRDELRVLFGVVRKNTRALVEFERTQRRLGQVLEQINNNFGRQDDA